MKKLMKNKKSIAIAMLLLMVAGGASAKWWECRGGVCCWSDDGLPPYQCS